MDGSKESAIVGAIKLALLDIPALVIGGHAIVNTMNQEDKEPVKNETKEPVKNETKEPVKKETKEPEKNEAKDSVNIQAHDNNQSVVNIQVNIH